MIVEIDFNSDEAIYIQLRNQIIIGIATERLREGETLPSVRQLADDIGINMHTVNKAYSVLKQEGFVKLDRRRGAVISPVSYTHLLRITLRGSARLGIPSLGITLRGSARLGASSLRIALGHAALV